MNVVFIILTVITAILLIGVVLVQKSKGGGLSSQFGGANQILGVRGTNKALEKTTWTLAALILVFSVCSAYTLPKAGETLRAKVATPAQQTSRNDAAAPVADSKVPAGEVAPVDAVPVEAPAAE